ncbi:MAG: hypothetical protein KJ970_19645 [Candidatus Eisenbacteria bacterium]|uniref:Apea-like HEPN domain-containing protein n=1 Tax=Eiseniibacteriota bacterium TaxID=2212470 RepID=A0A948S0P0_UNCEI|nr:hypothetical protein [Candidatus Eisenbacteria bacterium]MBU1949289.1 hypothetical protein [Candidatus Eisenbacteria bacterium]MBU2693137.1 hypothetical protein [Candidatus Eisenbacteria bacterium]
MAQIKNKYKLSALLDKLSKSRKTGNSPFGAEMLADILSVLQTAITFPKHICDTDKRGIICDALYSDDFENGIAESSLLTEITRREKLYLARPTNPYTFIGTISVPGYVNQLTRDFCDATIIISKSLPKYFDRKTIEKPALETIGQNNPENYKWAMVHVMARTTNSAMDKALRSLNCIRGVWNYANSHRMTRRGYLGRRWPVNQICLGPIFSLHKLDGKHTGLGVWYEPRFALAKTSYGTKNEWKEIVAREKQLRKLIKQSNYPNELCDYFVRYAEALDGIDFESSFLKLWSLLEALTVTGGANYDQTVKRALFPCVSRDEAKPILEHLRERRNQWVHGGEEINDAQDILHQLRGFVELVLEYHIGIGRKFARPGLTAELLDLPSDPEILKKRIALHKLALQGQEFAHKNS